jgi:solute carrier family 25 carnitine/acylcarnitine transporter 20/29
MTDNLGKDKVYKHWGDAVKAVWKDSGWKGYWRGFVPCFLRAFPANATALFVFESVMRALG